MAYGDHFITIAGRNYEVAADGAEEGEATLVGHVRRAYSGRLLSTGRGEKGTWSMTLAPMAKATYALLKADVGNGAIVAVVGTALGPIQARVRITRAPYVVDGADFARVAQVTIDEQ